MVKGGRMRLTKVTLHPAIITADSNSDEAQALVESAHLDCSSEIPSRRNW